MDRQSSIDLILDHYENPRNKGVIENASLDAQRINPGCGDVIHLTANLDDQGRITAIAFDGQGCTISQAAASIFTEYALGKLLSDVLAQGRDEMIALMGEQTVMQRINCVTLILEALKDAASNHADQ
jgi:nitrogen fixation protein NifU and related proteins